MVNLGALRWLPTDGFDDRGETDEVNAEVAEAGPEPGTTRSVEALAAASQHERPNRRVSP